MWLKDFTDNGGTIHESFSIGLMIAKWLTDNFFTYPANLTFEKSYMNLVMCEEKKNYFGWKFEIGFEIGKKEPYVEKKGLAMKRRGPTIYFKETCVQALKGICVLGDIEKAFKDTQTRLKNLENGNYEMYEMVEKRGLAKDPDEYKEREEVFIEKPDEELEELANNIKDEKPKKKKKMDFFVQEESDVESEDEDAVLENESSLSMDLFAISRKFFPKESTVVKIIDKLGDAAKEAQRPISKFQKKGIHPAGKKRFFSLFY